MAGRQTGLLKVRRRGGATEINQQLMLVDVGERKKTLDTKQAGRSDEVKNAQRLYLVALRVDFHFISRHVYTA